MKFNFHFLLVVSLALLLISPTHYAMRPEMHPHSQTQLFDQNDQPIPALAELLEKFDLHPQSRQELVAQTQKAWFRTAGKERWEAENPYESRKQELMPLFKKMGLVNAIQPQLQKYDYLLISGALHSCAKSRIAHAVRLWNNGVRFGKIVLLGCERKLDPKREPASLFNSSPIPETEYEMMKYVYEHTDMPATMRSIKTTFMNTPNIKTAAGKEVRATTGDTIIDWLNKQNPTPGSCLIISNQPFVRYQESVTEAYLSTMFTVDAAGQELAQNARVSDILDSLARWIFTEHMKKIQK